MDNLRLILLMLGVAVVAAVWAFEAWRRRRKAAERDDPFADFDGDDLAIEDLPPWQEHPPRAGTGTDDKPAAEPAPRAAPARRQHEPEPRDLFDDDTDTVTREEPPLGDLSPLAASRDAHDEVVEHLDTMQASVAEAVDASAHPPPAAEPPATDTAEHATSTASEPERRTAEPDQPAPAAAPDTPRDETPTQVVSLIVMARPGRRFVGHQIRAALESVGMRYGEMQIFHYHDADDADDTPLFSAVNALKPGTFDLARIGELSTTGVALFMQLPGPRRGDDARVFELMLETARHLAERLGGELGDAARRPLSAARLKTLRATVAGDEMDGPA